MPYNSFVHSYPFKFLVGPDKKEFFVHVDLLVQHSRTLGTIATGNFSEAKEGVAQLGDLEPDTFRRFVEYAYRGDYTIDHFTKETKQEGSEKEEPPLSSAETTSGQDQLEDDSKGSGRNLMSKVPREVLTNSPFPSVEETDPSSISRDIKDDNKNFIRKRPLNSVAENVYLRWRKFQTSAFLKRRNEL